METKNTQWYRADFEELNPITGEWQPHCDSEYYETYDAAQAVAIAKEIAANGIDYADAGHRQLELVLVECVDGETECFNPIETIWA